MSSRNEVFELGRSSSQVSWLEPGVLRIRFVGYVDAAQTERLVTDAKHILGQGDPLRAFVIDCAEAENYSPNVRQPGVALMETLRDAGAQAGFAVSASPAIRMIGTAVSFVAGTRVRFVGTMAEARAELDKG